MNHTISVVKLKKAALNSLLSEFQSDTQSFRIVQYLAKNSRVPINTLRSAAGAENISQVVRCAVNPRLFHFGYRVACERSPGARHFVWSLYQMEGLRHAS